MNLQYRHFPAILFTAALALSSTFTRAESSGSGFFSFGEARLEITHAAAVRKPSNVPGEAGEVLVFLSNIPLDAAELAAAFNPESRLDQFVREQDAGGYVRICISPDGVECWLYFNHREPLESFNTGGQGEFSLETMTNVRVAGNWTHPREEFFDKYYEYDLRFDVTITEPPPAEVLPDDGGEPGQAYMAWITALAGADFDRIREFLGPEGAWAYPAEDLQTARENLRWARDGVPVSAEILRAEQRGDQAVLWVRGADRDDIERQGRVLMERHDGIWRYSRSELSAVD